MKKAKAPASKFFAKSEFEKLVLNKTTPEMIAAVGRPDDTTTTLSGRDHQ